ncbi:MBL fold metallo-hydrolase [Pollutibacter soli]|uniref:MBL fold metallo-hydrolase n=1 Tax=Pollutibacter soli TaxID=3034157 RepID=UPI003013FF97
MKNPIYGRLPEGKRLDRIMKSPNYGKGQFQNLSNTPALAEGHSYLEVLYQYFFKKDKRRLPASVIPSIKPDLRKFELKEDILVWFGHSSYYIQLAGKRMLVDPVFSGNASPLRGTNKAFPGADIFHSEDIPDLDILFLTHDHYDHLDYKTVVQLKDRAKLIITGLGVGEHLELWGFDPSKFIELDWNEEYRSENFIINTTPARHFSGRGFTRNKSLWLSFVLETPNMKLFLGGDSGYDTHFAEIGKKFGPFDLAILEDGQYDVKWKYIHLLPEEVLKAARDLHAKRLFPIHNSKFAMSNHAWDDPLRKITVANNNYHIPLVTPIIGEPVYLKNGQQQFKKWWEDVR